ncbi:MAG: HEAT repeat domain-containing protein [Deltaproteobacteria bacterium]|nr:HEAT repeat domain-containing protein [Deltaproteobacteria bacterium]MCW5806236.1 HEAT repeat domain-containing protein [Deltaproteobacteria bacterium]
MKNLSLKLAAVAFVALGATSAVAGVGGSADKIHAAINSRSVDAIVAEIERAENLACTECVDLVATLTAHDRVEVREVAAWWFAKRRSLHKAMADQFLVVLASGDTIAVRNAADFLGRSSTFRALPALRAAAKRELGPEARLAMVRAVKHMHLRGGNEVLTAVMTDKDARVRAAAANAWREIRKQENAAPVVALLGDASPLVRAEAATTIGGLRDRAGVAGLEALVVNDPDATVRRNAAWALGEIGAASSSVALGKASGDASGLVRMTAKVSLGKLH